MQHAGHHLLTALSAQEPEVQDEIDAINNRVHEASSAGLFDLWYDTQLEDKQLTAIAASFRLRGFYVVLHLPNSGRDAAIYIAWDGKTP